MESISVSYNVTIKSKRFTDIEPKKVGVTFIVDDATLDFAMDTWCKATSCTPTEHDLIYTLAIATMMRDLIDHGFEFMIPDIEVVRVEEAKVN